MSFEFFYVVPVQRPEPVATHQNPPNAGSTPSPAPPLPIIVVLFIKAMGMLRDMTPGTNPEPSRLQVQPSASALPTISRSHGPSPGDGMRGKPVENPHPSQPSPHPQSHGTHPISKSSGGEPTGKQSDAPTEEVQNENDRVMPEPAQKGESGPKSMEEIARLLANRLIPEKFNFVFPTVLHFRAPHQNHESKETKPQAEQQHQKAPSSKSQAVAKGEAKTTQQSPIPEEIEPAEKIGKDIFQNAVAKLPVKDSELPVSFPSLKVEMKNDKDKSLEQLLGFIPKNVGEAAHPHATTPSQPTVPMPTEAHAQPQPAASPAQAATPVPMPGKNQSPHTPVPPMSVQPQAMPQRAEPVQTPSQPMPYSIPNDPAKLLAKGHAHIGKIPDGRDAAHVKPRQDAIPPREKNEQVNVNPHHLKMDDKHIPQFPIMPDFALSKEGILKELGHGGEAVLRDDIGFRLEDLILMLLCAVICGARKVDEVYRYLHARAAFFTTWMGLKNGLPSYRLLAILFYRLDPAQIAELYLAALGKKSSIKSGLRMWESDRGVILGVLTGETSIEIQEGMDIFDLKNAILTTDPQRVEPRFSRLVQSKEADYLVAIKGKHGVAYEHAQEFFGATLREQNIRHETSHCVLHEGSRVVQREVLTTDHVAWLPGHESWVGLRTAVKMKAEIVEGNRIVTESKIYVSSLPMDVQAIAGALRSHSTIENRVDWFLDLDFTRGGVEHVMANFDALRKISWELLNFDKAPNATPEFKRKKALVDNTYLRQILGLLAA